MDGTIPYHIMYHTILVVVVVVVRDQYMMSSSAAEEDRGEDRRRLPLLPTYLLSIVQILNRHISYALFLPSYRRQSSDVNGQCGDETRNKALLLLEKVDTSTYLMSNLVKAIANT